MPTMIDWLGGTAPAQCDGRSLMPFLAGGHPADWRREAHFEFDFRDQAAPGENHPLGLGPEESGVSVMRSERYKYVHFAALPPLLFDLENDPDEFNDLAGDPAHQGLVAECAGKMLSWRMRNEEPVPAVSQSTPLPTKTFCILSGFKDILKARDYRWNDGNNGKPRSWYSDVLEGDLEEELPYFRKEIFQRDADIPMVRITAFDRFSGRV